MEDHVEVTAEIVSATVPGARQTPPRPASGCWCHQLLHPGKDAADGCEEPNAGKKKSFFDHVCDTCKKSTTEHRIPLTRLRFADRDGTRDDGTSCSLSNSGAAKGSPWKDVLGVPRFRVLNHFAESKKGDAKKWIPWAIDGPLIVAFENPPEFSSLVDFFEKTCGLSTIAWRELPREWRTEGSDEDRHLLLQKKYDTLVPMDAAGGGKRPSPSQAGPPAQRPRRDDSLSAQQQDPSGESSLSTDMNELMEAIIPGGRLKVTNLTSEERAIVMAKLARITYFVSTNGQSESSAQLIQDHPFLRSIGIQQPDARDVTLAGLSTLVCQLLNRLSQTPLPESPAAGSSSGDAPPEPAGPPSELDVLIVVCSPACKPLPKAFDEAHAIAGSVRDAGRTAHILERGGAAAANALLQERAPRVVWFIGHGDRTHPTHNKRTLVLTAEDNSSVELMLPATLAKIFGGASRRLELVMLNSCQSAATYVGGQPSLCEAISQDFGVPTIGWSTLAADTAAQVFAIGVAASLAPQLAQLLSRAAIRDAFEGGKRAIEAMSRRHPSAGVRTDAWAIADPAERKQLPGGAWAAGVPMLLAPLPPELLTASGVPELPEQYQRRPKLEAAHRTELLRTENMTITASTTGLSGAAGAGKSSTAAVLARDVYVQTHFPDGVVWLAFGRERSGAQVLHTLAERLGVAATAPAAAVDEPQRAICAALVGRRMLLVLDDIWTREQLNVFCPLKAERGLLGRLVTTRNVDLAGEHNLAVTSLEEEEGMRVLASYMGVKLANRPSCPVAVQAGGEREAGGRNIRQARAARVCGVKEELHADAAAARLVQICCGNPAMLRSVAALCKKRGTWPALTYLEQCRDKMHHAKLPDADSYGTLYDALAGSLEHLGGESGEEPWWARWLRCCRQAPQTLGRRCTMLAVFPEDTQVPWCVVAQLWGVDEVEAEDAITELEDWNLIEADQERRTLSLIDLHLDYLRASAKEVDLARWHAALLHRCGRRTLGSMEDREDDSYWGRDRNVVHHLTACGEELARAGGCKRLEGLMLRGLRVDIELANAIAEAIRASGSLATLEFRDNNIGNDGAKALAAGVAASGSLASLNIGNNNIDVEGAKAIAEAVRASGSLATLDISQNNIGAEGAKYLAEAIRASGSLTTLILGSPFGGNNIGDEGAKALAEAIRASGSLATLSLSANIIGDEGAKALAAAVAANGSLAHLDISDNRIGNEGAKALAAGVAASGSLAHLDLGWSMIGDEGAKAIAAAAAASDSLATLHLSYNNIGAEGAKALAAAVAASSSLAELYIGGNEIGDVGAKAIADAVAASGSLAKLFLHDNRIGDEGAKALAARVAASGSLAELRLDGNEIGDTGAKAIADALAASGSLAELWLGSNKIGVAGAKAIADALAASGSLTELDLSWNNIGAEGAKALAAAVAASGSLAALDLRDNDIGDEGAKALAAGVAASGSLATLDLRANKIGPDGAKAFADAVAASGSLALKRLLVPHGLEEHSKLVVACKSKGVELV